MTNRITIGTGETIAPPPWPRAPTARLRSDAEAIEAAHAVAARAAPGAVERDRLDIFPSDELDFYSETGLWGATVPHAHGGAEISHVTLGAVTRIVAAVDSSLAQLTQNHWATVSVIRSCGDAAQQADLFAEILAGKRFGNAFSEKGTRDVSDLKTRFVRDGGDVVITGTKHYSSGALAADLVQIVTLDDEGVAWLAIAERGAPGLTVRNDWSAFGQRGTGSGTVVLDRVRVPERRLIPAWRAYRVEAPTADSAISQFIQAAIDAGLAEGALAETERFVRTRARRWIDAPGDRAADDPYTIQAIGGLHARLSAAVALLDIAGRAIDEAVLAPDPASVAKAQIEVAKAKILTTEIAVEAANTLFALGGAASTDRRLGFDRYWRNARTHTLHDPVRWKYAIVGDYYLNDRNPPLHPWS